MLKFDKVANANLRKKAELKLKGWRCVRTGLTGALSQL